MCFFFFFKQKTAYEMRISDWSSDVCSSDLIFAQASNDWRLAQEEIFGPVLVAIRWKDEAEAIRMANDSHYGLAAYVWTHDIGRGLRNAHAIESGWVKVNQGLCQMTGHSYGGYKQSGLRGEVALEGTLERKRPGWGRSGAVSGDRG